MVIGNGQKGKLWTKQEFLGYLYFDDGDVKEETTRDIFRFESIMFGILMMIQRLSKYVTSKVS